MADRTRKITDTLTCLTGFALGALAAAVLTGEPLGTKPELQKIKWRYQSEDALTGFLAEGAAAGLPKQEMPR